MAFTGAATTVIAQTFILQDPNGVVVAILGANTQEANNLSLLLKHNDVLTTDSYLYWTDPTRFGAGIEEVILAGPKLVTSPGVAPSLILARSSPGPELIQLQGAEQINLVTQTDAGAVAGPFLLMDAGNAANPYIAMGLAVGGLTVDMDQVSQQISISTDGNVELFNDAGIYRGRFYGVTRHEASLSGANVPSTVAAGILLTIVLPNCTVAGAWADISFTAAWLCQVAPANSLNLQIRVNGALVTPLAYTQNNANTVAGTATLRKTFAMPIGVNTIDLVEYGGAATYAILGSDQTSLTVVLHR